MARLMASDAEYLILPLAFLLGSIPFGFLLYRLRRGGDIRQAGSGNIGATNVLRTAGKGLGVLTLLLDAGKGWLAMWLALQAAPLPEHGGWVAAALVLVIAGHMYSPWIGFRGGKGVATALGAFAALAPGPLLIALLVFLVVFLTWRYVSLASICACLALPMLMLTRLAPVQTPVAVETATILVSAWIIVRHRGNIGRLRMGTETKIGSRSAGARGAR